MRLLHIGYGMWLIADRVKAVLHPKGAPMRNLRNEKYAQHKLIDIRRGKPCQAMILCNDDILYLSPLTCQEIQQNLVAVGEEGDTYDAADDTL